MKAQIKKRKVRRVVLAVSGGEWEKIKKATATHADEVFCDLEDALAPDEKIAARHAVGLALKNLDWGKKIRAVRINGLDTPYWQDDIKVILESSGGALDSVMIPKVENAKQVQAVAKKLKAYPHLAIECLLETPEGIERAESIATASPRVEALFFGGGDFAASMGFRETLPHTGDLFAYPRYKIVAAARAANIVAIDTPFFDFKDESGLTQACHLAAAAGFDGKMVIHPAQIETGIKIFTPSEAEVAQARKVVAAYAQAQAEGAGVIALDGKMIDVATVKLYENILARANAD